jgi:hypothetical protein
MTIVLTIALRTNSSLRIVSSFLSLRNLSSNTAVSKSLKIDSFGFSYVFYNQGFQEIRSLYI